MWSQARLMDLVERGLKGGTVTVPDAAWAAGVVIVSRTFSHAMGRQESQLLPRLTDYYCWKLQRAYLSLKLSEPPAGSEDEDRLALLHEAAVHVGNEMAYSADGTEQFQVMYVRMRVQMMSLLAQRMIEMVSQLIVAWVTLGGTGLSGYALLVLFLPWILRAIKDSRRSARQRHWLNARPNSAQERKANALLRSLGDVFRNHSHEVHMLDSSEFLLGKWERCNEQLADVHPPPRTRGAYLDSILNTLSWFLIATRVVHIEASLGSILVVQQVLQNLVGRVRDIKLSFGDALNHVVFFLPYLAIADEAASRTDLIDYETTRGHAARPLETSEESTKVNSESDPGRSATDVESELKAGATESLVDSELQPGTETDPSPQSLGARDIVQADNGSFASTHGDETTTLDDGAERTSNRGVGVVETQQPEHHNMIVSDMDDMDESLNQPLAGLKSRDLSGDIADHGEDADKMLDSGQVTLASSENTEDPDEGLATTPHNGRPTPVLSERPSDVESLDTPDEQPDTEDQHCGMAITLSHVSVRYPDGSEAVRDVSLDIAAGETLAIVGHNGSGKTTLIKALLGLQRSSGEIKLNGVPLRSLDPRSVARRITTVFQDTTKYGLTLREEIEIGSLTTPAVLSRAVERGGASDILKRVDLDTTLSPYTREDAQDLLKPDRDVASGYQERTARETTYLSGGEWRRIALARAFMREDADLIVFDEPTAALDPRAESELFETLLSLGKNRRRRCTTIFISHGFGNVRRADNIAFMEKGSVIEYGTHEELIALGGRYSEFYHLQANRFK